MGRLLVRRARWSREFALLRRALAASLSFMMAMTFTPAFGADAATKKNAPAENAPAENAPAENAPAENAPAKKDSNENQPGNADAAKQSSDNQSAEPASLNLIPSQGLDGWQYGDALHWRNDKGALIASKDAKSLVSGFVLGDFEMTVDLQIPPSNEFQLGFRNAQSDNRSRIALQFQVDVPGDHTLVVKRKGNQFEFEVVGKQRENITFFALSTPVTPVLTFIGGGKIRSITVKEPEGAKLIADPELTGWYCEGNKKAWVVENGTLVKRGSGGNYLRSEKEYENFLITFAYRIAKGGNSGLGIRTPKGAWPSREGMEMQLLDKPGIDHDSTMAIYRNVPPLERADKSLEWNDVAIRANGPMISAWVNGKLVQHANAEFHPELKYHPLKGWIGFQDHGAITEFKNLRITELPNDIALPEWSVDKPEAMRNVLDRIMNLESLATRDNIQTVSQSASIAGASEEETLCELQGPGAWVGLIGPMATGDIALYFDGEAKPRVECKLDKAWSVLPRLSEHAEPLVTCVPFAKSLKIVIRKGKKADYVVDWLKLPATPEVESYVDSHKSVPRGWLASIDYRHSHFEYGDIRTIDPFQRKTVLEQSLAPGKSLAPIVVGGSGIVEWIRIDGDANSRKSRSLWLHIQADGAPEIVMPLSLYLASIADGKRFHNFVTTSEAGLVSTIAIPYGKSIQLTLENRGETPIANIGLTAAYLPTKQGAPSPEHRLHAAILPDQANDGTAKKLTVAGSGRVVLLCCREEARHSAVLTVSIDGQPAPGLAGVPVDALAGNSALKDAEEFKGVLSGRMGAFAWRYPLLAPIEFKEKFELSLAPREGVDPKKFGNSGASVLYYQPVQP